ncbi:MAG: flagellar hook-basal body complex protein [Dehalococcoidia bacterium]|nr:flagellar hook-basal body complex protein [Dehalococcoidia bacterium]
MIRGLYTAASGMITGLRMQDTVSENLANVTTTGYKGERAATSEFAGVLARRTGPASGLPVPVPFTHTALGRVGTGSYVDVRRTVFGEGVERETGQPLDFMVRGSGFLVTQTPDGIRYTRDGRLSRDANNTLVQADGDPVLDVNGQTVTLANDRVRLATNGDLFRQVEVDVALPDGTTAREVRDEFVTTIQVVDLQPEDLVRAGDSDFVLVPGALAVPAAMGETTVLVQGSLEESNVEVAQVAAQLMSMARTYGTAQHVFGTIDRTLETAVRDVGRVG